MISEHCFTRDWIESLGERYSRIDPALAEKSIYAFELLSNLARFDIEFTFKGGTALLLKLKCL